MKTIILVSIFLVILAGLCRAETFVIYNNDTNAVYSLSGIDDAIMPKTGYTKTTIKDNLRDLDLQYPAQYYKFNGNRLIPNTRKLDEEAIKEEDARKKADEEKLINERIRKIARDELIKEGKIND